MTILVLSGQRYSLADMGKATLYDLLDLKKETGLTVKKLEVLLKDFTEVGDEGAAFDDMAELLGSEQHILAFASLIWLARRRAGERDLTVREASDFPVDEIGFEVEEGDEVEADEAATDPQ